MTRRSIYRLSTVFVSILWLFCVTVAGFGGSSEEASLSPFSMDMYGSLPAAHVGDLLTVVSGGEVLCGKFTIRQEGQYGFLHVYGDDTTTDVREGAGPQEELSFYLNGQPLTPLSGQNVFWLGDGRRQQVDFTGR